MPVINKKYTFLTLTLVSISVFIFYFSTKEIKRLLNITHQNRKVNSPISIKDFSRIHPDQLDDIMSVRKIIMGQSFDTFVESVSQNYNKHIFYQRFDKIKKIRNYLSSYGEFKKEVETGLENIAQMLQIWQSELNLKFEIKSDIVQNSFKDALTANDPEILFKQVEANQDQITHEMGNFILNDLRNKKFVAISRSVSKIGHQNIALGYDGKPVNLKGKSSRKTGFIPVDQRLSKLSKKFLRQLRSTNNQKELLSHFVNQFKLYQHKSLLSLETVEEDFLPTSIKKPYMIKIENNEGNPNYRIGVIKKEDLSEITSTNLIQILEEYESGYITLMDPWDIFPEWDKKRIKVEGLEYLSSLLSKKLKHDDLEIVCHHSNPRTIPGMPKHLTDFKSQAFKLFIDELNHLKPELKKSKFRTIRLNLLAKNPSFFEQSFSQLSPEEFIAINGRKNSEFLRSFVNKIRVNQGKKSFFDMIASKITESENKTFNKLTKHNLILKSIEISSDVDTWAKSSTQLISLDNFNYNNFFDSESDSTKLTQKQQRQDKYNVFIDYPSGPDLLKSAKIPTRLSKHYYENFNIGFPQKLSEDYPLSMQIIDSGGHIKIKTINLGGRKNPHEKLIKELEKLAQMGVFIPLNPVDIIKNFKDYQRSLTMSPNASIFFLKFLHDFASPAIKRGLHSDQVLSHLKLKPEHIIRMRQAFSICSKSIADHRSKISSHLEFDEEAFENQIQTITKFWVSSDLATEELGLKKYY